MTVTELTTEPGAVDPHNVDLSLSTGSPGNSKNRSEAEAPEQDRGTMSRKSTSLKSRFFSKSNSKSRNSSHTISSSSMSLDEKHLSKLRERYNVNTTGTDTKSTTATNLH